MTPLFVLPFTLLVVLASSTSGDQHFCGIVILFRPLYHPFRIEDERERLVTSLPVMTKSWGPSWGKQIPGERPRETAET